MVSRGRDGSPTRRRDRRWDWESQGEGDFEGGGREVGSRKRALAMALALVDLVPSCRRVRGRQLEGELEIRSSKRSWTI